MVPVSLLTLTSRMPTLAVTTYALRFIAGKYKGGEFPLRPNREIIVGRGSEFDMVLDEDMVSRRHAKIATYHGQIVLQDLKSTNGTFVNGERVTVARLKVGDKLLVGSSIMELVKLERGPTSHVPSDVSSAVPLNVPPPDQTTQDALPKDLAQQVLGGPPPQLPPQPTLSSNQGMSGRYPDDDVTVPDLVELFNGSGRSGVLQLTDDSGREGQIYFREGTVYFAEVTDGDRPALDPVKALYRMLTWPAGEFVMQAHDPLPEVDAEIEGDTRQLLIDGVRQWDELKRYEGHLPTDEQRLALLLPLEPRLSALSPEALDTLQVVLNYQQVALVLDCSDASDLETYQDLLYLIQNGYLTFD